MEKNNSLFRENSKKKLSDPEQLNEYVKVIKAPVWIVLAALIVLFAGFFVWGTVVKLDKKIPVIIEVEGSHSYVYFSSRYAEQVKVGQKIYIDGLPKEYHVTDEYTFVFNTKGYFKGDPEILEIIDSNWTYGANMEFVDLQDGFYNGYLILDSYPPITYLFQ